MITIKRNEEKNGIELTVGAGVDLTDDQRAWLRSHKFKWSKRNGIYWRYFSRAIWDEAHEYFSMSIPALKSTIVCDICGKEVKRQGIGTHKRLKHGIIARRIYEIEKKGKTETREVRPSEILPLNSKPKSLKVQPASVVAPDIKAISTKLMSSTGKDLTECKRPDRTHLYTETDLWILMGRICQVVFGEDSSSLLSKFDTNKIAEELIKDFERRFECKFSDVKKANPGISPGKTDAENWSIASRYASLKYSR